MVDFLVIEERYPKRDVIEIYPNWITLKRSDLMIRGGDFYAVWIEERKLWSTDEDDVILLVDRELQRYLEEHRSQYNPDTRVKVLRMADAKTRMINSWRMYCREQLSDNYHILDQKLIFANQEAKKEDYASKKLPYPLLKGECPSYDRIVSVLYSEEERRKLEWCIGAIVSGDSRHIQKFCVLYGDSGTGKSTVLNIVQQLFEGYCAVFDAKALGSSSQAFALESFSSAPLVAIQHDGDLSRIEDNTRLNSLVSHETMPVNTKHKSIYSASFKSFLFMGTNKPVKITDAKSGLIRRLIDVTPSGNKLSGKEYRELIGKIKFELGAIAYHCLEVYQENPHLFDNYIPINMMEASNDLYNYIVDSYDTFKDNDGVSLKEAWDLYKAYCTDANVPFPLSQRAFKEEMKTYFKEYTERGTMNGSRVRNYFSGFKTERFEVQLVSGKEAPKKEEPDWLIFSEQHSLLDDYLAECTAQYANQYDIPSMPWDKVTTKLKDLDTSRLHYVLNEPALVTVDFDIPDENGNKSFEKNVEEARKWLPTYAELSKSGEGIHLEYIYDGDPSKLAPVYGEHIEIKVRTGNSALRRKVTKCNDIPIAHISSGLPLKGEKLMVNQKAIQSEKGLRRMIKRNLCKEIVPSTKSSVDFIFNDLKRAYESGMKYDVSDMYDVILAFAASSTHQAEYCMDLVDKMKFKSDDVVEVEETGDISRDGDWEKNLCFFDIEMARPDPETDNPGLFLICWKYIDEETVHPLINPTPSTVYELFETHDMVGFFNRNYDNHMCYARAVLKYDNDQLYDLSTRLTSDDKDISKAAKFGSAYNWSKTDVYDFCSEKKSLKKWEIELKEPHDELTTRWDEPIPVAMWPRVVEYCKNDVRATEAVFKARQADWTARKILAKIAGGSVNDTTNALTTKFIFGSNRNPQSEFEYRHLWEEHDDDYVVPGYDEYTRFTKDGKPVFPGYSFEMHTVVDEETGRKKVVYKSIYRGEEVGEGGYVCSEHGIYGNVGLLDSASHHPSTICADNFFGPRYTARFKEILNARIAIKHGDFDTARTMLDGALAEFLTDETAAADVAYALKIAINSVYGLTSAKFPNPFKHPDNYDNYVAKRGALFMINLKHEVQKRGYTVAHIKTDSIKIPDMTPEIAQFVYEYGKLYGYTFEHEATYDRMCLVNNACYIAKYATEERCEQLYGYSPKDNKKKGGKWTATAEQFQVPYVFKTLFSHEPIEFDDMCETKSVSTALYLDYNENLPEGEHDRQFVGRVGEFTPVAKGMNGGELVRLGTDKKTGNDTYDYANGSKGYRWLPSTVVKEMLNEGKNIDIDRSYYDKQVTKAVETIVAEVKEVDMDFDWFVSDRPYVQPLPFC